MSLSITNEQLAPCIVYENTVITTLTNSGYILYTLNMLKSLKQFGLDNKILIVCIDIKSASIFRKLGYHTICINDQTLGQFCSWNSKGYDKICYLKIELLYRILSLQNNVLLIDGDIVFQKNPLDDILLWQKNENYDVWIQNDSQINHDLTNLCTGYMYIKSSIQLCNLYECISEKGRKKYMECAFDNNDQTYFNKYVKPYCRVNALPLEKYPNGKMFYENADELSKMTVLVHFNWVKGHVKMAKIKEYKMWLLNEDEEC